jgi:hypothetical protein
MAKIHRITAKEPAMTKSHKLDDRTPASRGELTEDQLKQASGGQKAVAPRDSVSGNSTGRRAYKAVD